MASTYSECDTLMHYEDRGLQKIDSVGQMDDDLSFSSSYGGSVIHNNIESAFSNGVDEVSSSEDSKQLNASWGYSASVSASSDPASFFRSVSSDYSCSTRLSNSAVVSTSIDDFHDNSSTFADAGDSCASKYYLRAHKDVFEVSPSASAYSRSASIAEWASPLSPALRTVFTYSASIDISSEGIVNSNFEGNKGRERSPTRKYDPANLMSFDDISSIYKSSLSGSAVTSSIEPFQAHDRRLNKGALSSEYLSLINKTESAQEAKRSSIAYPYPFASSSGTISDSLPSTSKLNQVEGSNGVVDTNSIQWDSNPFRKLSIKKSGLSKNSLQHY